LFNIQCSIFDNDKKINSGVDRFPIKYVTEHPLKPWSTFLKVGTRHMHNFSIDIIEQPSQRVGRFYAYNIKNTITPWGHQ
jgi:hypothetical protein